MSGIVGVWNLDGKPVDRTLLKRMTDFMTFRGPDAQEIWSHRHVGFGHALLKTTFEAEHERQPYSLDGETWIVADARVDGQDELIDKLNSRGENVTRGAADVQLLAYAYRVWGERCVEHLLGDFSFAVWDAARNKLFCARDHLGIKPFYYAQVGSTFVFSNTLNAVRLHQLVDDQLNDLAIADFLLFETNADLHQTTFSNIHRAPPAHTLSLSGGGVREVKCYWAPSQGPEIRYRSYSEYVDHFRHIFDCAVRDRLRIKRVSVPLSGGMDSSSVAATAKKVSAEDGIALKLSAHTYVYDRLVKDSERYYSGLVSQHLGIPICYQPLDDYCLFERWEQPGFCLPEPFHNPTDALVRDHLSNLASSSRVALSGSGGDPVFCPSRQYLGTLFKSARFLEIVRAASFLWTTLRSLPPIGVRTLLKPEKSPWEPPYPDWLNPDLEKKLSLRERWTWFWSGYRAEEPRADLLQSLHWQGWASDFERQDPGVTREAVEFRYPFFDRRVIEFALCLPAVPWCVQKSMLRSAMAGLLPGEVLRRRKTRLGSNGMVERLAQVKRYWEDWSKPAPELSRFVTLKDWKREAQAHDSDYGSWRMLIPVSLNLWLFDHQNAIRKEGENVEYSRVHSGRSQEAI
jgi:asparagine synthase (glutamine-hydrolysing)